MPTQEQIDTAVQIENDAVEKVMSDAVLSHLKNRVVELRVEVNELREYVMAKPEPDNDPEPVEMTPVDPDYVQTQMD